MEKKEIEAKWRQLLMVGRALQADGSSLSDDLPHAFLEHRVFNEEYSKMLPKEYRLLTEEEVTRFHGLADRAKLFAHNREKLVPLFRAAINDLKQTQ